MVSLYGLNMCMASYYRFKTARVIGIWAYKTSYVNFFIINFNKLILESYFDISMCTLINVLAFIESKDLSLFWSTTDDIICSLITIIHSFIIVILPFFSLYLVTSHWKKDVDPDQKLSLWLPIIKVDIRQDNYFASLSTVFFIFRRLLTVLVLILLVSYPLF